MAISGVFASAEDAERAIATLKSVGFSDSEVSILTRGDHHSAGARGLGAAMGGVLGMGAATFLVPGLGPIAGIGLIAAGLAGAGLGAAAGKAADKWSSALPHEDLYFYEQALYEGQTLVFVDVADPERQSQARNLIEHAGARNVHTVRREWWNALRHDERQYVHSRGLDFDSNEAAYRSGFEAALHPSNRGRAYEECVGYIQANYPEPSRTDVFRVGFDRGQQYLTRRSSSREVE
jgi:hypothetical protein